MSPADWLRRGHPEALPTLFIDRSLGRIKVPALLREAGLELVTLAEHYGIPQDETVADVTWLADTAARGWVALGKDERIRRRPAEKAAVRRHGARCFYFTRGDLPAEVYVERILANLDAITRACAQPGRSSTCCTRTGSSGWRCSRRRELAPLQPRSTKAPG